MLAKLCSRRGPLAMLRAARAAFSTVPTKQTKAASGDVARSERLQFSKARLTEFGELPFGEIPTALKYDRPFNMTKLSNGVRVCTEALAGETATIAVHIKAGSRNETIETSGVAHFLEHLNLRGTSTRTRAKLEEDLYAIGGAIQVNTGREVTSYSLTVLKKDVPKAVEVLGDILFNSLHDKNQIEAEREGVYRTIVDLQKDQMATTLENVYYTCYRDHMMGQPRLGIRENIGSITQEQIKEFQATNYIGPNIVVVGAGAIPHEQLVELSEKAFGVAKAEAPNGLKPANTDKPYFTPSMMTIRDDEMANANLGVFFEAPSWTHEDFYAFNLFQRVLGEYSQDKYTGHHLNSPDRQYNQMHIQLGFYPDITIHKPMYKPYSDTGLFGSYFLGNEVHLFQMLYMMPSTMAEYAFDINVAEVFRARNKFWNELTHLEGSADLAHTIGPQILYLNRRIPRSEIATRVSNLKPDHLQRVATKWCFDKDISIVSWGAVHSMMSQSHYGRPIRRATLGWYGNAHYYV